jgi:tetratricopeptide (TPR) repeat protein
MRFHTTAALLLCAAASWTMLAAPCALAQMGAPPSSSGSSSSNSGKPTLSSTLGPKIIDAEKAVNGKDYQGALTQLKALQGEATKPYDVYVINRLIFAAAVNLNDMATATTAIDTAAASPAMPDADKKDVIHNALLMAANSKQWPQAIAFGQQLAQLNGLDAQIDGILAIAYYDTNNFPQAQQYAQQSINLAKAAGQQPDPNALQIIMGSQVKQNNQGAAEQTLEQIALQNPTPQVWAQLVGVAFGAQGMGNSEALYLFRLLQLTGGMTADDYKTMASAATVLGYPTEAVNVLNQGISAGKISEADVGPTLTKAHRDAAMDERALPQIAAAAEKSRAGEQEVKLGEDYWGYGRYPDAEAAARAAMAKGGLKTPWEGPMLLGASQVAQGKYADAMQSLSQVSGSPAVTQTAHLWSLYAQSKAGPARASAAAAPAQTPSQQ